MIGGLLEVSGYEVFQAATLVEASSKNKQRPFDLLMVANGLSELDKSQLHATMQLNGGSHVQVRLIELLDRADQISTLGALASAQVVRSERSILLKTLSTLMQSQDSGKEASHESYIQ
jgi:DNA-binding response OmpR family regulator